MDRNELLSATRAEYLRGFSLSVDQALLNSVVTLYKKADGSYSSFDQVKFLDARGILMTRDADLRLHMHTHMEQLLNRSMQTTYSTFRPSFLSSLGGGSLALVDSTAFEDELRIGEITNRFRREAEEHLRDLNIRIAILFEQDNIKERENPFRPYLLSRSIATAVESIGISAELSNVLLGELAENMAPHVAGIYDSVNLLLASNGVAAQLQLKIARSANKANQRTAPKEELPAPAADGTPDDAAQEGPDAAGASREGSRFHHADTHAREADRPDRPKRAVDQLLDLVRGMATTPAGGEMSNAEALDGQGHHDTGQYAAGSRPPGPMQDHARGGSPARSAGGPESEGNGTHGGAHDGAPAGGQAGAGNRIAKAGWLAGKQVVGEVLRKLFSSSDLAGKENEGWAGGAMRQATVQLATSLDRMILERTPASADMLAANGDIRNLLLEQRASLNNLTEDVDEQMTIDVVAMLFEFILRDPQVPAEVRAQLGRLQFLVLKIALLDTSLLTQKGHPARLLVNRIGSISLGLKQVDPSGLRITAEVCRIVEALLSDGNRGANRFLIMLDDFDAFIANELRAGDEKVERAVQLAEKTQSRTLHFVHATAKMNEALSSLSVDPFLHEFLVNAWVRVIERAERSDAKLATRFRLLVPDLLWSLAPKAQEQDRTQLFALLPIILSSLREGLAGSDQPPKRQQSLLNWLVDAHTSALRSSNAAAQAAWSLSAFHQHFKTYVENPESTAVPVPVSRDPVQYRRFLDESLKELDIQIELLDRVFEGDDELPGGEGAAAPGSDQSVIERLRSGVAIALNLSGQPCVGRLNWIDPHAADMVLTLDQKSAPSMISVRTFLRLYTSGRVSFLESAPLFERAMDSLLKSADKMDRKGKVDPGLAIQGKP